MTPDELIAETLRLSEDITDDWYVIHKEGCCFADVATRQAFPCDQWIHVTGEDVLPIAYFIAHARTAAPLHARRERELRAVLASLLRAVEPTIKHGRPAQGGESIGNIYHLIEAAKNARAALAKDAAMTAQENLQLTAERDELHEDIAHAISRLMCWEKENNQSLIKEVRDHLQGSLQPAKGG